jgi:3-phenylpropionate/trans-cinnamate dioxygenase ferredoxin reductase subunit
MTIQASYDVVIVGAGHAGAETALKLRQHQFGGSILVIGDEPELPYERPPLSKEYLSGDKAFERLSIRPASFWEERDVSFLLGNPVSAVAPDRHQVIVGDSAIGYGKLVWAAGGEPRKLSCSGYDLVGVHYIRRRSDVDRLKAELADASNVAIVGGGYIGLEAAAVMRKFGKTVTVIEVQDRVLARVAGEPLSRFFEQEHRSHGVEIRLGVGVDRIEGEAGRVSGVRLASGEVIPAQVAIVGIGIIPNVAALLAAGAKGEGGVFVDPACRTSLPDVFAVGDCAEHTNRFSDSEQPIRLESVQNAADQADVVAQNICGRSKWYEATPWFWSNQYDIRLQTVGLSRGYTDVVVRGRPEEKKFSVIYLRNGVVIALDCVNSSKDYIQGRALVEHPGKEFDLSALSDINIPLKYWAQP